MLKKIDLQKHSVQKSAFFIAHSESKKMFNINSKVNISDIKYNLISGNASNSFVLI